MSRDHTYIRRPETRLVITAGGDGMTEEDYIDAQHKKQEMIRFIARAIVRMDDESRTMLRDMLEDEGGNAGVAAVIPPNMPLREGGAEVPFEDWPEDYWESQA